MTTNASKVLKELESTFELEMSALTQEFPFTLLDAGLLNRLGEYTIRLSPCNNEAVLTLLAMIMEGAAPLCRVRLSREEALTVLYRCLEQIMAKINGQKPFLRRNITVLSYSLRPDLSEMTLTVSKEHSYL